MLLFFFVGLFLGEQIIAWRILSMHAEKPSKAFEFALKFKRLKQIKADGKEYTDYLIVYPFPLNFRLLHIS